MKRLLLILTLALGLAVPAGATTVAGTPNQKWQVDYPLSKIASVLSNKDVFITCPTIHQWNQADAVRLIGPGLLGWVYLHRIGSLPLPSSYVPDNFATLRPDLCRELHDYLDHKFGVDLNHLAWAVLVLAHETQHLDGYIPEELAECHMLKSLDHVLNLLNMRGWERKMVKEYVLQHHYSLPEEYQAGTC